MVLSHSDAALKKRLDAFVIKAMVPVLEKLGWEPAAGEGTVARGEGIDD